MDIIIDGKVIEVLESDKNIIDVADRAKVSIPCACYRNEGSKGCCRACVVDIDGEHMFACATKPESGMNVVVGRDDLKVLRTERLTKYRERADEEGGGGNCACGC